VYSCESQVGSLFALQAVVNVVGAAPVAALADRVGPNFELFQDYYAVTITTTDCLTMLSRVLQVSCGFALQAAVNVVV